MIKMADVQEIKEFFTTQVMDMIRKDTPIIKINMHEIKDTRFCLSGATIDEKETGTRLNYRQHGIK